jgi:glycosyltransferase involved in cell wall biosynthesis
MGKVAVGAVMKQEAPYILEWVAYHRMLGFDVIIADNGGEDDTSEILKALHRTGACVRIDFTWLRRRPQIPAYRAILRYARRNGIDIIGFLDADEFFSRSFPVLSLSPADGAEYILDQFERNDASQISYHWICYGSRSDSSDIEDPVLERFSWHSSMTEPFNTFVKSFVRVKEMFSPVNLLYIGPPVFSPHYYTSADRRWFIDDARWRAFDYDKGISHNNGCILHFQIKTWAEYQSKAERGNAIFKANNYSRSFFETHDYSDFCTRIDTAVIASLKKEIGDLSAGLSAVRGDIACPDRVGGRLLSIGLSTNAGDARLLYRLIRLFKRVNSWWADSGFPVFRALVRPGPGKALRRGECIVYARKYLATILGLRQ